MIVDAIYSLLTAQPYALAVQNRAYFGLAPEPATAPYLVYFFVSDEPIHTQDGPADLMQQRFQFSILSPSQSQATADAFALRALLDGYTGTVGSTEISASFCSGQVYLYDQDTRLSHVAVDFEFQYKEL